MKWGKIILYFITFCVIIYIMVYWCEGKVNEIDISNEMSAPAKELIHISSTSPGLPNMTIEKYCQKYVCNKYKKIKATITAYSKRETCPNHKCRTACGTSPQPQKTIACPRRLACGTKVQIAGQDYICEDRTAKWIEDMYSDVFDIFMDDYNKALEFGRQFNVEIKIYE